jgi:glycolate oxidase
MRRIGEISAESGLRIANVFHAGDGNLHPLILFDEDQPGQTERTIEAGAEIMRLCAEAGGSLTGEHGIGVDKACAMPKMFSERDLGVFARVRAAVDPLGLANPGKVLPTPRLCGEVPGPYRAHPLETVGRAERF